jgi:F-type H+-transporting ATPase subunit alpha
MKKVAGTLRLDLAQFRELESFAQFGSDLDKSTLNQINRGQRMVELLKQPQFQPMPAEKEVLVLYAGTRGYLDEYPVSAVLDYEAKLLDYMDSRYKDLLDQIKKDKDISPELDGKIKGALDEFKDVYKAPEN